MKKKIFHFKKEYAFWKRNSLAAEMWLVILVSIAIFGIAFFFAFFFVAREAQKNGELRESETVIHSVQSNIEAGIANNKDISRLIMLSDSVLAFLEAPEVDPGMTNDAKYGMHDILNVSSNLDSVFIFRNDGDYVSTGRAEYTVDFDLMDTTEWRDPILSQRGGAIVTMNAGGAIHRKSGEDIITVARAIYDIYTQEQTGILLLNISGNMLTGIVNGMGSSKVCILSSEGQFLAGLEELAGYFDPSGRPGRLYHRTVRAPGSHEMISTYRFTDLPLTIICSNHAGPSSIPAAITITMFTLFIAFALSIAIAATVVSRRINKPIYDLANAMEQTRQSGWLEKVDLEAPPNEIGILVRSYNNVIDYLNDLFTRMIENEKSVQRAQMRVLQEQIKPHFLYNSLATISYMAYEAGAFNVYEALETLGNFYRNFLSKGDREITIRREINIVKDYLALQKLRYGEILTDEYDIAEDTEELMIPKLLLQPLVENCIYHGIRPKGEPGIIRITTRREENHVRISVYDDGVGMSQYAIEMVMAGESPSRAGEMPSGFGLKGTIDRIRFYCNSRDVAEIDSIEGEYTNVTFTIPIR